MGIEIVTQVRHYIESLNWRFPLTSYPQSSGNSIEEEAEKMWDSEGMEDTRRMRPSQSAKPDTYELTGTETANTEPTTCVCPVPLHTF